MSEMRTDVSIDLFNDDEGLYQAIVRIDGERIVVDPRMVTQHVDPPRGVASGDEEPMKRRYRFEWIGSARVYAEVGAAASDPTLTVVEDFPANTHMPSETKIYAPLRGYVERDLGPDEVDGYFDDLLDVDFLGGTLTVQPTEWYGSWEFESATLVLVTSEKLEAIR